MVTSERAQRPTGIAQQFPGVDGIYGYLRAWPRSGQWELCSNSRGLTVFMVTSERSEPGRVVPDGNCAAIPGG